MKSRVDPSAKTNQKGAGLRAKVIGGSALMVLVLGLVVGSRAVLNAIRLERYQQACQMGRDQGKWEEVAIAAEAWMQLAPGSNQAKLFAAEAKQQQGDYAASAAYLDALDDRDPLTGQVLMDLALMDFGPRAPLAW